MANPVHIPGVEAENGSLLATFETVADPIKTGIPGVEASLSTKRLRLVED